MNKDQREIYFYTFFIILLFLLIFNYSFKDGIPTCNHYMMNTYLYIGLAFTLIGTLCYLGEYYGININFITSMLSFLLTLVLIFAIQMIRTKKNIWLNHLLWLMLIIGFTVMIYPVVSLPEYKPYINQTIMTVVIIFLLMTMVTYVNPAFFESTYKSMMTGLIICLFGIIIVEIINLIYKSVTNNWKYTTFNRVVTYFVILVFTLLIAYDTTELKMKARVCKETNVMRYPNYPLESLSLILDIINLFVRILSLQRN